MPKNPFIRDRTSNSSLHQIPGEITYVGSNESPFTIEIIDYDEGDYKQLKTQTVEDILPYRESKNITWINISGLNDTEKIREIGEYFKLHSLILEDIVDTRQRPKIEEHDDFLFIILKMLYHDEKDNFIKEHLGLVHGKSYVLTFQEENADVFDGLRMRIFSSKGRIRNSGADYLMYAILDSIVDNYFAIMEDIAHKVEVLEDKLFIKNPDQEIALEIQYLKREIIRIRKSVLPLREVINQLLHSKHTLLEKKTYNYIRDLNDHIIQVCESIDIYREIIWNLMEMYMTTISNKMNEVMKVLTIITSIFVPITFIAGVYGMNFQYMPELDDRYAYFIVWGIMLLTILGMIIFFKRKKWM